MSKSEVLYVKGMDMSESEDDGNAWDDRKLNDAYDKAIKIANIEIAKRIAMSTNTQTSNADKKLLTKNQKAQTKSKVKKTAWKVGMPCRAVYDEDGLEYEAYIVSIIKQNECIVQFLGYNNLQVVELSSLLPSLEPEGHKTFEIKSDQDDGGFESQSLHSDEPDLNKPNTALLDTRRDSHKNNKKTGKNKKVKQQSFNDFTLPDIPMPDMSAIRNLGLMEMPLPPPPPQLGAVQNEQQAVSSMLLSWYMSGYYTGLYQGMKRAKEENMNGK
ncbi:unnamed protein product [Leptosia nina]|uniref:Tudor domain-containing protein n=1 Tax=Leptosia nina TaxID=320188 RepID=A0AAV1IZQ7_9NEOP